MVQKVRLLLEPPRRVALRARAAVRQEIEAVRNGREQTIGKDNALRKWAARFVGDSVQWMSERLWQIWRRRFYAVKGRTSPDHAWVNDFVSPYLQGSAAFPSAPQVSGSSGGLPFRSIRLSPKGGRVPSETATRKYVRKRRGKRYMTCVATVLSRWY